MPSEESDISDVVNDDTKNDFKLNSDKYVESSSDEGEDLAKELVIRHMQKRSTNPNLHSCILLCVKSFITTPDVQTASATMKRKRY